MVNVQANLNQEALAGKVDALFAEYDAHTHGFLEIAVVGGVSSGKSSFLNAFFDCSRESPKFPVSALAGATKQVKYQQVGDHIQILDTPGLQDTKKENVETTKKRLSDGVDIGILLIADVANEQQLENYKLLQKSTKHVFVVLNKVDRETKENLRIIKAQWREVLGLDPNTEIYEICCRGYDFEDRLVDQVTGQETEIPVNEHGVPLTIRGIQTLKEEIFQACFEIGKIAFIAKSLKQKQPAAIGIIVAACVASIGAIIAPGTIAFIMASQATAISSLGYLYNDKFPSREEITKIIKIFSTAGGGSIGAVAYGVFMSFIPPTGVFDVIGIIVIVSYMATTLLIVNSFFSQGLEIKESDSLQQEMNRINKKIRSSVANADVREVGKPKYWTQLLSSIEVNVKP